MPANNDENRQLLEDIRTLMILDLVKGGTKQGQIADALGVDAAKISKMFPKGLLKDISKGG